MRTNLGQGIGLVALGLVAGVAGAYGFSRLLAQLLFATAPTDTRIYIAVAAMFALAALLATLAPARRAISIDPLIALRTE